MKKKYKMLVLANPSIVTTYPEFIKELESLGLYESLSKSYLLLDEIQKNTVYELSIKYHISIKLIENDA